MLRMKKTLKIYNKESFETILKRGFSYKIRYNKSFCFILVFIFFNRNINIIQKANYHFILTHRR